MNIVFSSPEHKVSRRRPSVHVFLQTAFAPKLMNQTQNNFTGGLLSKLFLSNLIPCRTLFAAEPEEGEKAKTLKIL